jgi:hypothetical protein
VVVLIALFASFPRTTWPEQVGIVGALFGVAVCGGPWVGLAATLLARTAWLLEQVGLYGRFLSATSIASNDRERRHR